MFVVVRCATSTASPRDLPPTRVAPLSNQRAAGLFVATEHRNPRQSQPFRRTNSRRASSTALRQGPATPRRQRRRNSTETFQRREEQDTIDGRVACYDDVFDDSRWECLTRRRRRHAKVISPLDGGNAATEQCQQRADSTDHDVAAVPKMATMAAKRPCSAAW
jgi:hypothetical protein